MKTPALVVGLCLLTLVSTRVTTAAATQTGSLNQPAGAAAPLTLETPHERDARMKWWRDARFGMFIHWGLYAIPAGEWKGKTDHAEWIRESAKIPLEEYNQFLGQFNPVKFNPAEWSRLAHRAGMKYLVITSKHHDGFALWDSKASDFDVMATPFKRDILKELSAACRKQNVRFCTYHSIMDWHHPDYLPRRTWEKSTRSADGADFDRFRGYLKSQLAEIVRGYNPGVMWFDGEWEATWTHAMGEDLDDYVRGLNKKIIINNRVDKGRHGMAGQTREGGFRGDFGTPEQEIPDQGIPGVDWESCMTMNAHWGWNAADTKWKSTEDLVRKLIDIASKGGNFLLNIGPRPDGTFPDQAVERLEGIGRWMDKNSSSIYGTHASPIGKPAWGRCTQKELGKGKTRLYLHVFDWPNDGQLVVTGINGTPIKAALLDGGDKLKFTQNAGGLTIEVPAKPKDTMTTVITLDITKPKTGI
ncbi:MAG: alpha-L-fucosidase [Verrucomicrobia bacterium]|nr:alpha-L-fucosidase [Verrucomicrobiota bacterium]